MSTKPSNPKAGAAMSKLSFLAIPIRVLGFVALALAEGAHKYGRHNFRRVGVRASTYFDATLRHLFAYWEGEDLDPDSKAKLHHIDKAIASLVVMRDAHTRGALVDDRPPKDETGWLTQLNSAFVDAQAQWREQHGEPVEPYLDATDDVPPEDPKTYSWADAKLTVNGIEVSPSRYEPEPEEVDASEIEPRDAQGVYTFTLSDHYAPDIGESVYYDPDGRVTAIPERTTSRGRAGQVVSVRGNEVDVAVDTPIVGVARAPEPDEKRIVIESPLSGATAVGVRQNLRYLLWCMRAFRLKGYDPIASHMLGPWYLDDADPNERQLGIDSAWCWDPKVPHVFMNRFGSWSEGMKAAMQRCKDDGIEYSTATLYNLDHECYRAWMRGEWPPHTKAFEVAE